MGALTLFVTRAYSGASQIARDALDIQGEMALTNEARSFARRLSRVLTDRERVAVALAQHLQQDTPRKHV